MSGERPSLKALAVRGSVWTIAGQGAGQLIRLANSLVLTRLLFPEAFGLMSLVWVVMYGLEMFSDVGVGPAIIRDERGDEPDFLNTAWTLQVIRGGILCLGALAVSGPMAAFYHEPALAHLIPVAGLSPLISGFNSTALHTSRRRMEFGRLTILELSQQIVGFVVVVVWAYLRPTVWALVGGALAARAYNAVMTHVFLPGIRNRFHWERSALNTLVGFGKWIFFSSMLSFIAVQSDRLLLGHYLEMSQLGVYSIAVLLSDAVNNLALRVNHGVLFPAYGNIVQRDVERIRGVCYRARRGIDLLFILPVGSLMVLGTWVVGILYDERYHAAGWMLQILCIRVVMACALANGEACLVALGHPKFAFAQNLGRALWIVTCIPIGWSLAGMTGVVWAVGLSQVPVLCVIWYGLIQHRVLYLRGELRSVGALCAGLLIGGGLLWILP